MQERKEMRGDWCIQTSRIKLQLQRLWLWSILLLLASTEDRAEGIKYNTKGGPVEGKLNVHLVPHTHDDVGWLKTVDQYYVGSNSSIQVAAVQYILDSVISSLQEDANRKFIYVEVAFFARWWTEQAEDKKDIVRNLVKNGQLEFINGGWCMHDEASTYYVDMIDQTTLGHQFLKKEFDVVPRIGWQIDPFGHSAVQGYLLSAEVGFEGLYFARADYQDIAKRREDRTMEMIWRGSKSLGPSAQVFTGILAHHYDPPDEFRYDIKTTESVIQDDPFLYDYNVEQQIDRFVELAKEQAKQFCTNHIMWTMGEDFAYENANTWFKQMDKLIHYANKDGRVNAFYSTPSIYTTEKNKANESWPLKTDDFFPYADCEHCYWTGYFSSRPALKGYVRKLSGFLQASRQLEVMVGRKQGGPNTDSLEKAMAILQHHDAVSGTEKQHVANDYALRLSKASIEAEDVIKEALLFLMSKENSSKILRRTIHSLGNRMLQDIFPSTKFASKQSRIELEQCPLLNISYCPKSEVDLDSKKSLVVVVYNALGWTRTEVLKIPVTTTALEVLDPNGRNLQVQFVPVDPASQRVREYYTSDEQRSTMSGKLFNLYFEVSVPPLGYAVYYIKASPNRTMWSLAKKPHDFKGDIVLKSSGLQMTFSSSTGLLKLLEDSNNGISLPVEQSFCWYNGSDGNTGEKKIQASGAYVFRPNTSTCFPIGESSVQAIQSVTEGDIVSEVFQEFSPWVTQVVRLYKNGDDAEIDFLVGPIPIEDNLGKEIVTQFITNISSNGEFFTDSNGRDFLKRVRNYRADWDLDIHEPVAGNYYPLNLGIYLRDKKTELSLLVDRALGGSSIADGELEIMLHRRLLHDDGKGVGEALNETVCINGTASCEGLIVQGRLYLNVNPVGKGSEWRRTKGSKTALPLQMLFATVEDGDLNLIKASKFSALIEGYELPPNVAIITLKELDNGHVLLRLAHIYEIEENSSLSTIAKVNIKNIFRGRKLENVVEVNLSAVKKKSEMNSLKWKVEGEELTLDQPHQRYQGSGEDFVIELSPMEIKTLEIELED